jgi:hypothetical protein
MCELPRFSKNPLEQSIYTLKNEGQEGKQVLSRVATSGKGEDKCRG